MTTTGHLVPPDEEDTLKKRLDSDMMAAAERALSDTSDDVNAQTTGSIWIPSSTSDADGWLIRGNDGQPVRLNVEYAASPLPNPETDLSAIRQVLQRLTESQDDLDIWLDESVDGEESTAIMVDQDNVPVSLVLHFDPKTGKLEALHLKENPFAE